MSKGHGAPVCKQDMIWFLFALDCAGPGISPAIIGETWSSDTLMAFDSDDDADLDLADFQNAQSCFGPLNEIVSTDGGVGDGAITGPKEGHLFTFTTGEPGTFTLEPFMYRVEETQQTMIEMYTVVDLTVVAGGSDPVE